MNEPINRIKQKWVVDNNPDANGNWTIRAENAAPYSEPVATVYGLALAQTIVSDHNFVISKEEL